MQPDEDLELEAQLVRIMADLSEVAAPPAQRHVVGTPLQQAGGEVPWEPLAETWQVLGHQLLLQRVSVGRHHDPLAVPDRAGDRRDEVRQALAGARAGLHDQRTAAALHLCDREQHLHLRLAVLIFRQHSREGTLRPQQRGHEGGIVGRFGAGLAGMQGMGACGGSGNRVRVGRGQGLGEEPRDGPFVRRDQRQHRFLQPFVEGSCLLPQA